MKKSTKTSIIVGVVIVVIGVIVLLCAFGVSGWSLKFQEEWEQETFRSFEWYSKIEIKASAGKVVLKPEPKDCIEIKYDFNDMYTPSFEEKGDTLCIKTGDNIKWYDINSWFKNAPTMEISVPLRMKGEIFVELNAGALELCSGNWGPLVDIKLNAGALSVGEVVVDQFNVDVNAGALQIKKVQCSLFNCDISAGGLEADEITCDKFEGKISAGALEVKKLDGERINLNVSAGAAELGLVGAQREYSVTVFKNAGNCNVTSTRGGADFTHVLFIYLSAGSVNVSFGK